MALKALITGASSGIGEACAKRLAAIGSELILIARRQDRLRALKSELQDLGASTVHIGNVDIRNRKAWEAYFNENAVILRDVDVLINNAGLAKGTEAVQRAEVDDWDAMIDTNIKGLLYVSRSILPGMVSQGRGHVVNLGSVAGRWVYPGGAVYCATKFAVRALSEGLRMDLIGTPVRVTNIEPGMVETEFSQVRLSDPQKAKAVYKNMTPLTADDIAEAVMWSLERPPHINVQELVLFPTDQAAINQVHRQDNR